ncbi:MAG: hypothetical protein Q9198_000552 [Flavoplaca austrocitrina]
MPKHLHAIQIPNNPISPGISQALNIMCRSNGQNQTPRRFARTDARRCIQAGSGFPILTSSAVTDIGGLGNSSSLNHASSNLRVQDVTSAQGASASRSADSERRAPGISLTWLPYFKGISPSMWLTSVFTLVGMGVGELNGVTDIPSLRAKGCTDRVCRLSGGHANPLL